MTGFLSSKLSGLASQKHEEPNRSPGSITSEAFVRATRPTLVIHCALALKQAYS